MRRADEAALRSANYRKGRALTSPSVDVVARDGVGVPDNAGSAEADPEALEFELRTSRVRTDQHGARLDRELVDLAPEFSRSHLQTLIEEGLAQVEARVVTSASTRVKVGQMLRLSLRPTSESLAFRPEVMALSIVHEDDDLLVVDKPAGLVVHPAAGNWSGTLLNGLLAHHSGAAHLPRAGIVHRLDKDTSGLMVVGKTLQAVTGLARCIAARQVRRVYRAVVHGSPSDASFEIDAPIGRDPVSRLRMAITRDGRQALTYVNVLGGTHGFSALRCRLHTGRTHQIRVHLASRGHPLVGDRLYGGAAAFGLDRQALHAAELSFAHPISGGWMEWHSEPPEDFLRAWMPVIGDGPTS